MRITTYKRFFRLLRKARESGVIFVVLNSNLKIKSDKGKWVNAHSIWSPHYFSGMTAYLSPFQVLHRTYFQKTDMKEWLGTDSCARAMGLPLDKQLELSNAQIEGRNHLLSLRRRMLKACGLTDIPNDHRSRYEDHGSSVLPVDEVPF